MKNKNNSKKIIILIISMVLLIVITGISYSFFVYNKTGLYTQTITGGKIQVLYNETTENNIIIDNAYPLRDEEALSKGIEFEFTITGYNESDKDAYYAIEMDYGEDLNNKERFLDKNIKVSLYENNELCFENEIFDNLDNEDLYYGVIKSGTSSESPISNTYKMQIWINDNVIISDTLSDDYTMWNDADFNWFTENYTDVIYKMEQDGFSSTMLSYYGISIYTTEEFRNMYANFKVNVTADLEYKDNAQPATCFSYNVISSDITYNYPIITLDTSDDNVNTCKTNMTNSFGNNLSVEQDGYDSFCRGTGLFKPNEEIDLTLNINEFIAYLIGQTETFDEEEIRETIKYIIPTVENVEFEIRYYKLNTTSEGIDACKNFFMSVEGDISDAQDGFQSYCEGTGMMDGKTLLENDELLKGISGLLIEKSVFTQMEEKEIEITNYNVDACGSDVWIPEYIEGYPVTRIADQKDDSGVSETNNSLYNKFDNKQYNVNRNNDYKTQMIVWSPPGVFENSYIKSIYLPKTLKYIGSDAFRNVYLNNIIIPNGVEIIAEFAFYNNNLTKITIPNSVKYIGLNAFYWNPLEHVIIKGNPVLENDSFYGHDDGTSTFHTFEYGGTCEEVNSYAGAIYPFPDLVITSDSNSCWIER